MTTSKPKAETSCPNNFRLAADGSTILVFFNIPVQAIIARTHVHRAPTRSGMPNRAVGDDVRSRERSYGCHDVLAGMSATDCLAGPVHVLPKQLVQLLDLVPEFRLIEKGQVVYLTEAFKRPIGQLLPVLVVD